MGTSDRRGGDLALWIVIGVAVAAYAAELAWEVSKGYFPPEVLPLQASFAAVVLLAFVLVVLELRGFLQPATMSPRLEALLHWAPRIAILGFVGFISLLALDVFGEGYGFWGTLLALAWRFPWVGAIAFVGWAVFYLFAARGAPFPPSVYLLIAGLPFLLGILFLLDWQHHRQLHHAR